MNEKRQERKKKRVRKKETTGKTVKRIGREIKGIRKAMAIR